MELTAGDAARLEELQSELDQLLASTAEAKDKEEFLLAAEMKSKAAAKKVEMDKYREAAEKEVAPVLLWNRACLQPSA